MTLVVANFKMNYTDNDFKNYFNALEKISFKNAKVILCLPHTSLHLNNSLPGARFEIGAQNMHSDAHGAHTGEISGQMIKQFKVYYCLIGHSERRGEFKETNQFINKKVLSAVSNGLKPILCVGESKAEREQNKTKIVLNEQIKTALAGINENELKNITVAYEPIWAIGTSINASGEDIKSAVQIIKQALTEMFGESSANNTAILYGGSINTENYKMIINSNVNGLLIGTSCLDVNKLMEIVGGVNE